MKDSFLPFVTKSVQDYEVSCARDALHGGPIPNIINEMAVKTTTESGKLLSGIIEVIFNKNQRHVCSRQAENNQEH
jgi:hypothetical protein